MSDAQLATRPRASQQLAAFIGMEPNAMLDTIKVQCFRGNPANISNEQLAAFVSIAAEMGVNPLLPGMLYAYPVSGGGVVPIMGPDGVYKKLMEHPEVDSWETEVFPADVSVPPTHATTKIWRKGRERPLQYTALLSEWRVTSNPNWNSRSRHMLSLRSLKQCARQIIHGIPGDEDDRVIMGEINITPEPVERAPIPERKSKGARAAAAIDVASTSAASTEKPAPAMTQEDAKRAAEVVEAHEAKTKAAALKDEPAATPAPAEKEKLHDQVTRVIDTAAAQQAAKNAGTKPARTDIKPDEVLEGLICIVDKATGIITNVGGKKTGSAQIELVGAYKGAVHHFGGGTTFEVDGSTECDPLPIWKVGSTVRVSLSGKYYDKLKKTLAIVEKVEAPSGAEEVEFG